MTFFMKLRERLRNFIMTHEVWVDRVFKGVITLIALEVIANSFGYSEVLSHLWMHIVIALLCSLVPVSAMALVVEILLLYVIR